MLKEEIEKVILENFDIKKIGICDYPNCNRKPERRTVVYEKKTKRGLAILYLCGEHFPEKDRILRKFANIKTETKILK